MTRFLTGLAAAALLLVMPLSARAAGSEGNCPLAQISKGLEEFAVSGKMDPEIPKLTGDANLQRVAPFKSFDNVYYVGVCWVSAWLIKDPEGDILIDTLHEPHVDTLIANLLATGTRFDDIKYVLITHGHFDHAAGAAHLKPILPNAKFVMTQTGWDEATESAKNSTTNPWQMIAPEVVARDGDQFTVGKTVVTAYETPGHTFGTASYGFAVNEGAKTYRAIVVGGLGLNAIKNLAQVEGYVASIKRLQGMTVDAKDPITVNLTTHPPAAGMFAQADKLLARKPDEPNPFVDPAGFKAQLAQLLKNGEERVTAEKAK